MSEKFHSITAKLLYIMKRTQPDIETAVTYLCTKVSQSSEDDWKKLRRLLSYCKGTINNKCKKHYIQRESRDLCSHTDNLSARLDDGNLQLLIVYTRTGMSSEIPAAYVTSITEFGMIIIAYKGL